VTKNATYSVKDNFGEGVNFKWGFIGRLPILSMENFSCKWINIHPLSDNHLQFFYSLQ
jgi:hypothetical protein